MSTPPLIKLGRGGAGNYHGASDLESLSKPKNIEDVERQAASPFSADDDDNNNNNNNNKNNNVSSSSSSSAEYAYTGRGGSGNVFRPRDLAQQQQQQEGNPDTTTTTTTTTNATAPPPSSTLPTFGGRGGAGNIRPVAVVEGKEHEHAPEHEHDEEKLAGVHAKVKESVEAGLSVPEKAHFM